MSFENRLKEIEQLIISFKDIVARYPDNVPYQKTLIELQLKRTKMVDQIGRNK